MSNSSNSKASDKLKLTGKLTDIMYIGMFTAITAIFAQICIPFQIPFTLQTLAVFLAGAMLGWKRGTISVLVYIMLAAVGAPVLAGLKGGVDKVFGVTGGYILGFILTALIVGGITEFFGKSIPSLIISMTLGLMACYILGTVWYCIFAGVDFISALLLCVVPFLPADAAKIAVAVFLVKRLENVIKLT